MLKKPIPFSFKFAHISLAFVGLMWVLPFLYYHHAYPITTFYQEWGAGLLGLCAFPLLSSGRFWQAPEVPRIVMLPIGFMLLLLTQFAVGRFTNFDHLMLLALYFLFTALLMMLGQCLREELGLPVLITVLAVFLLIGAELNTLSGVLQHYRLKTFLDSVVTVKTSSSVYGNTAQPNHFANYIAMGLISLGLIYARLSPRIGNASLLGVTTALLAMPMLFVLVLSGSRSSWLYLLFVTGLSLIWQRRNKAMWPLMYYSLLLLLGFGLMHFVVELPWLKASAGSVTTVERLFGDEASGSVRLHLWREAGLIFAQFPLIGAGFGQFAFQHLQLAVELHNPAITGLYNNAHNIVMQIAAETGFVGLAVFLGTLCLWFWQSVWRDTQFTIYHWWGFAILAVLGIHSMLEYPLWYLYFIGVAAVLLGIFDVTTYRLELRAIGRVSVVTMLVLGALSLYQMLQAYQHLEKAIVLRTKMKTDRSLAQRTHDELMKAYKYTLMSSYAELFIANMMEPNADQLEAKMELNGRALHFIPVAPVVYHQAWFLAISGKMMEAKAQLDRAIWAYPKEYPNAQAELEVLVRKDPARFSPLLEFATQKYEEYQRAVVSAK